MNKPRVVNNPLDNLDFQSEDFKEGVNHLAQLLKVPQHPDHLVTLKAISILIRNHLSAEAGQRQTQARKVSSGLSIDSSSSGFQTGDKVLDRAVKVLRLLFISDLRDLQTDINEIIVAVQALTANPKTDTALGKVGKWGEQEDDSHHYLMLFNVYWSLKKKVSKNVSKKFCFDFDFTQDLRKCSICDILNCFYKLIQIHNLLN